MKVLLTGGTGFLGSYIAGEFSSLHELITIGRSAKNDIKADFSSEIPDLPEVDWIIHAASPAHFVPKTSEEEQSFFDINVAGTQKLLEKIKVIPKLFIFISTVAVYGLEEGETIDESHALKPNTPYGKSKVEAEKQILKWAGRHQVKTFILRLPLVVGKNPPGNLAAIAKAIRRKLYLRVGNGLNKKSMVLAEDVAKLLLELENKRAGIYHLCDPEPLCLSQVDSAIASHYDFKIRCVPELLLRLAGRLGDSIWMFPVNTMKVKKLSSTLTFNTDKAIRELGWKPQSVYKFLIKESII